MAGREPAAGQPVTKAGALVTEDAEITLKAPPSPYVSRGGEKLAPALEHFQINPQGKVCLDAAGILQGALTLLDQPAQPKNVVWGSFS